MKRSVSLKQTRARSEEKKEENWFHHYAAEVISGGIIGIRHTVAAIYIENWQSQPYGHNPGFLAVILAYILSYPLSWKQHCTVGDFNERS